MEFRSIRVHLLCAYHIKSSTVDIQKASFILVYGLYVKRNRSRTHDKKSEVGALGGMPISRGWFERC